TAGTSRARDGYRKLWVIGGNQHGWPTPQSWLGSQPPPPVSQNTGGSRYFCGPVDTVDAVVAAYARSDLFAKRRKLMEQWEAWCLS
ncbi:MAG: hypothetical protein VX152_05925, partial [Pseudomonadota bacterium]|nr:hypothetical protein [Pseudomonadota bacterium]